MTVDERVEYDAQEYIAVIENALEELKKYYTDDKYAALLGDMFVRKLKYWNDEILHRRNDPFTLVVCGDFKRGKSSLINAILGEDAAIVNITTETVTLNRISYGMHSNEAMLSGGRKIRLTDEELQRDSLERIMKDVSGDIVQLNIKRPIELLKDITIIDTPGMDDAIKNFSGLVESALRQADAVIYLFSVNYPLSQREQMFLKAAVIPQRYTSLYIIGNYADVIKNADDIERMQQLADERIKELPLEQSVYLLSALDERCRQLNAPRPNAATAEILSSRFDDFRRELDEMIQSKKEYTIPERMNRMLRVMLADLDAALRAAEIGLEMQNSDIKNTLETAAEREKSESERLLAAKAQIDDLTSVMKKETQIWMDSVFDRMESNIEALSTIERGDILKYYSFFCVDTVQEALDRCIDAHVERLFDCLEAISDGLMQSVSITPVTRKYSFQFSIDCKTWTKGDNVGFFASRIPGLIGYIGLGIGGAIREAEARRNLPDLLGKIRNQFPGFRISAGTAIDAVYNDIADNIKKQFSEFCAERVVSAEKQLELTIAVARQNDETKKKTASAISELRSDLAQLEQI